MQFKNFIIMSTFFLTLFVINLFVSNLSNAMFDSENEVEERKTTHVILKDQKRLEEIEIEEDVDKLDSAPAPQDNSPISILPNEILMYVFGFLTVEDLGRVSQVSRRWCETCNEPQVWRKVTLENYRDYFSTTDLIERPKEKVILHYLSIRLNVLDTEEEANVNKKFKEKYSLTSFTPYFKIYLPRAVKNGHESFSSEKYGKFEGLQNIETEKKVEKLRRQRDNFIKQAISESKIETVPNPYHRYSGYYMGGKECISSIGKNPTMQHPVPNKAHLRSARKINERLILLGDEGAAQTKKEQLTTCYSEYTRLNNLYKSNENWDNFVKSFAVDELCSKGYLFAFGWKIEWLVGHNEDGRGFIASMLQNGNPIVRNMGHYLEVFGLKKGKLGYNQNQEEAAQYIRFYNVPY